MYGEFGKLDAEKIEEEVEDTSRELYRLQKIFTNRWKKMRMEADERQRERMERQRRGKETVDVTNQDDGEPLPPIKKSTVEQENTAVVKPPLVLQTISNMLERVGKFKEVIPVIRTLCNPGIRQRHWDAMSAIAQRDLTPDSGTSLAKMLQLNLTPFMDQFEGISVGASKEHTLEMNLHRMREDWRDVCFNLTPYRELGISILASVDDIQQQLDDQIVKTQTMRGSPYIKPFELQLKVCYSFETCVGNKGLPNASFILIICSSVEMGRPASAHTEYH